MRTKSNAQNGFTLIELSVVLVVIGLIIGSVLVGAGIVQNAKVTSTVNAIQAVQSAIATYNQNYNALPGDDAQASARFSALVTLNGGGDGVIGTATLNKTFDLTAASSGGNGSSESLLAWQDLRAAGLVKGAVISAPPGNSFGGIIGIQYSAFSSNGITGNVICASGIPGSAARVIDQRLDDGNALTGNVRGGASVTGDATEYADGSIYVICMPAI